MAKKIYDVMPPKVAKKVENAIASLSAPEPKSEPKKKTVRRQPSVAQKKSAPVSSAATPKAAVHPRPSSPIRFPSKEIIIGGVIVILLAGIYFLNALPRATVTIAPSLNAVNLQMQIIADKTATEPNIQNKIIPLQILQESKDSLQSFPATGASSNDSKATGTMTIYNKSSPATPISLLSGTHFLSDSGKYFVTLAKVTVPAMQGKTPGSVTVKVQADQPGADYNIGPSKFSIPKLSGSSYYYSIWGESSAAMKGGSTGKVKTVTQDDLDGAKDVLTQKLLDDAENSLKSKILQDDVLVDGAIQKTITSQSADKKVGDIADNFTESVKVTVVALVFKKQDVQVLVENGLNSQLSDGQQLLTSSLKINYAAGAMSFDKGTEQVNIQSSASSYSSIDTVGLADALKGKNADEIKKTIDSQYGGKVSMVQVDLWPFWVNKAPNNANKVKINLAFDQ